MKRIQLSERKLISLIHRVINETELNEKEGWGCCCKWINYVYGPRECESWGCRCDGGGPVASVKSQGKGRVNEQGQSNCKDPNSPYNTNFPEFCYVQNGVYHHQQPGMSYYNHPDADCCGPIDGGPDVYWDCVNGNCEQGGTQFATEQECEDSNCEERARPGGYGGKGGMSRIRARALSESRLRRLVKRVINESNIVNEQAFDQGLYMSSMNGDAYSQCMLCKQMYMFSASKKQSRCMCSNCPCSGQWQQQLQCMICQYHYSFSSSKRQKHCQCSSCVCSAGWGTGGNTGGITPTLGVDKNFKGSKADMPGGELGAMMGKEGMENQKLRESDLRRIIKRTITNYEK